MMQPDLRPPHARQPGHDDSAARATEGADATERAIRRRAERMQHRRRHPGPSPLRGLSALGVLGWSVALPTVGGALLGLWLEQVAPQPFSWPLALMLGGLVIGAVVAWEWMSKEGRSTVADQYTEQDTEDGRPKP
ncbi:MAG: hypothetical protein RBR77_03690 [Thauera sp.]|jgi:ATP synthase protein I|nr:hypothetical protein [Thauera sp.]